MEGQQIWSSLVLGRSGDMLDSIRFYHLVSHLLEEDTMVIIGNLAQVRNE
jgi:hypothetical protein